MATNENKRIKDLSVIADETDIKEGNYFAVDCVDGTKKLPADKVAKASELGKVGLSFVRSGENALPVSINVKAGQYLVMYAKDPDGVGSKKIVVKYRKEGETTELYDIQLLFDEDCAFGYFQKNFNYEVTLLSTTTMDRTQNINIDIVDNLQDSILFRLNTNDETANSLTTMVDSLGSSVSSINSNLYKIGAYYTRSGADPISVNLSVNAGDKVVFKVYDSVDDSTNKFSLVLKNGIDFEDKTSYKYPGKKFVNGVLFWVLEFSEENVIKTMSVTDKNRSQRILVSIVNDINASTLYEVNSIAQNLGDRKTIDEHMGVVYPSNCGSNKFMQNIERKICALVDDDGNPNGMWRITDVCDAKGIKATFALITSKFNDTLDVYGTKLDYYKALQNQGYDFACHSFSHDSKWYNTTSFDETFVLEDLAKAYRDMMSSGLLSRHPCFVYPGSCGDSTDRTNVGGMRKTRNAVRNYFDFAFLAGHSTPTAPIDNCNAMQLERFFLHPTQDADKTLFKSYVSSCAAVGKAPIIATHSAKVSDDHWDEYPNYIQECVEYMLDSGYEFVTLSQLAEILTPLKNVIGMYSPNV